MDYSPWGHKKSDMTEPLSFSHNRQLIHPFTQHTISQSKSWSLQMAWEALLSLGLLVHASLCSGHMASLAFCAGGSLCQALFPGWWEATSGPSGPRSWKRTS